MEELTQKDRVISIRSPLGEDFLLLNKVRAEEKISELFAIDVELLYHERENDKNDIKLVPDTDIIGQTVSIKINQDDDGIRIMTGLLNSFNIGGRTRQFTYYYATVVPHIWLLTRHFQSRIFQQKSVPDILREVFSGFEFDLQLKNDYKQRNYCVQYQESDFDFASRLMEEEGIYYYFEHTPEMDKLILRDDFTQPEDCPRVNVSHDRELLEVQRLAIHVGTHVQKDGGFALLRRKHRGECRPIDNGKRAHNELRSRHHCAGVAGADHTRYLSIAHQSFCDANRRVLLFADRSYGGLFHRHHFAGVSDLNRKGTGIMTGQQRTQLLFLANENDWNAQLRGSLNRAFDFNSRRMVAAHGVYGDLDHAERREL